MSEFGGSCSDAFDGFSLRVQDAIGHGADCFFQNVGEVAAGAVIGRGKEIHAVLVRLEPIALAEALAGGVIGVVDCDAVATLLAHDGEAGHIGGTIADVNHVFERHGAQVAIHVVIHIFCILEHALVDAEEKLCLGGVGDDALGEVDAAATLAELAGKDFSHVGADDGAIDNGFDSAGDDVELHPDAGVAVLGCEGSLGKLLKEVRQSAVEGELLAQFAQAGVAHVVDGEFIKQFFEVTQFAVPAFFQAAGVAFFPELGGINPELGEDGVFLHVVRAERLVEIEDESNGILRYGHGLNAGLREKRNLGNIRGRWIAANS